MDRPSSPPETATSKTRNVLDFAHQIVEVLRDEQIKVRAKIDEAKALFENVDLGLTRRVVFEIAGDFLKELGEKRAVADKAVQTASQRAARSSATTANSASRFTEARRLRAALAKATAKAKQSKAKFQLVYDTVLESELFARKFEEQRQYWISEFHTQTAREAEIEETLARMVGTVKGIQKDLGAGVTLMEIDLTAIRKFDVLDAAHTIIESRQVFEVTDEDEYEAAQ